MPLYILKIINKINKIKRIFTQYSQFKFDICRIQITKIDQIASQSSENKINTFLNIETINEDFFNEIVERKLNITRDKFKVRHVWVLFDPR